jgi:hypothetical protein
VRSWRELDRVLRQELAGSPDTLTLIGPLAGERREVTFFEPLGEIRAKLGRALWVVPESVALAATLERRSVATVERDGLRYFIAGSGLSQPAGGTLVSAELFAAASGLDPDQAIDTWERDEVARRLLDGLPRVPASAWLRFLRLDLRPQFDIAWRPLAGLAAAVLVGYLAVASAYLAVTTGMRERQLEKLGPEVETLVAQQRDVERRLAEREGIARVLAGRTYSYEVWRPMARAWAKGAKIGSVTIRDDQVTMTGNAPVATDVLAAIAAEPGIAKAAFTAPVQRQGEREQFVIGFTLKRAGRG